MADPSPASPDRLFAALDALGIPHKTVRHPPLFTVEQSQALRGTIPGGHTKNLFLRDKKHALFLVVAGEDAQIDLKSLHRVLGAAGRFSFGSADLLRDTLQPGPIDHVLPRLAAILVLGAAAGAIGYAWIGRMIERMRVEGTVSL